MRVSYNWLKEYLALDLPVEELAAILTSLGLEVSSVERKESIKGGLKGVVAGKVLSAEKHPNADRLTLTTVDIGDGKPLNIVCGAPNVAKNQTVWVATVGTTLYPSGAETPLNIAKAKVRGEFSEGMICAEDELGLGKDHSGILILPDAVKTGTSASEYYGVVNDDIIEIELTPNRSDAICHLGVARDLAAWYTINRAPIQIKYPALKEVTRTGNQYPIDVEVKNREACPRYCGIVLTNVTVKESPQWLQNHLRSIDVRPINIIVDITNFVLHEMGQPLHAFDADQINGRKVIVQTLPDKTPFVTLDNVTRTLSSEDLMICDGENHGMCIAGVYGGLGSGITNETRNVFLESAHFHPRWIRRTSMRHDLRTEAARTFEKATDPNISRNALIRAVNLMEQYAGAKVSGDLIDTYPEPVQKLQVTVRYEMVTRLIGVEIPKPEMLRILDALEMQVIGEDNASFTVTVPTNKPDVTRESDVIEEILRIYGFDQVRMKPKLEIPMVTAAGNNPSALRQRLGDFLAGHGFLEIMGISMIDSRQFEEGPLSIPQEQRVLINNTSNVNMDLMRHTLLATALETVRFNQFRMQQELMLYEFGKQYIRNGSSIDEQERLSLVLSGNVIPPGWRQKSVPADFFLLKKFVQLILGSLGITPDSEHSISGSKWDYAIESAKEGKPVVVYGKIHPQVLQQYDLRNSLFYADFSMSALMQFSGNVKVSVTDIPKFPSIYRDIAIIVSKEVPYSQIEKVIGEAGGQLLTEHNLFDIYEKEAIGKDKRSLAISLIFQDDTRTLSDAEVNKALEAILKALEKETGAVLR